jgi:3'-phosphoadenosine 5'-phosphosulfate sulfotransferase (PAPS reductase)/FAD synthetase
VPGAATINSMPSFRVSEAYRPSGDQPRVIASLSAHNKTLAARLCNEFRACFPDTGIRFPETREYVEDVLEVRDVYARAYADELGLR